MRPVDASLLSWFAIFHRRYRNVLLLAMLAGSAASVLVYLDDTLLGWITSSLADPRRGGELPVPRQLVAWSDRLGLSLPFLLVGLFFVNRVLTAGMPCLMYGAGDVRFAHAPDERISVSELAGATATVALALALWCGVAPGHQP